MPRPRARAGGLLTLDDTTPCSSRVVSYRRASTDEANQPFSLDAQEAKLTAFIDSQPGWTRVGDYTERASGKDIIGRPQLQRLLRDAAAGKFDTVLVYRVDRWTRSLADLLATIDVLDKYDVSFRSATEPFDTATPLGRMLLQMLGTFAEFERSMIIDRIVRGNAAKVAKGIPLTRRAGYGLLVGDDGRYAADPATIGVVKRIFAEYVNDQRGTKAIAIRLNDDAIPGPGAHGWSADSVARVLRNRAFVGDICHRRTWLPGVHAPIIDQQLFAAAQGIADKRGGDNAAAAARRGDFLLTGTLRCARCGGAYVGSGGTSKTGATHRYYSCVTARRWGASRCTGPNLPADDLEALVTDSLLAAYTDSKLFAQAIAAHLREHAQRHQPRTEELTAVQAAITAKRRVRDRYQDDYEAGKLAAERYETRAGKLDTELAALRHRAAELQAALEQPALAAVPSDAELSALRTQLDAGIRHGNTDIRKALFRALIDGIDIHDLDDIRPTFRLYEPRAVSADALTAAGEAANQTPYMANDGREFASRRIGWS